MLPYYISLILACTELALSLPKCSPGRIRTYNLLLTRILLLPKGLDYLMSVPIKIEDETRVYSLYTFILRLRSGRVFRRSLARDSPDDDEVMISGVPRISPIFTRILLLGAANNQKSFDPSISSGFQTFGLQQEAALPLSYRGMSMNEIIISRFLDYAINPLYCFLTHTL